MIPSIESGINVVWFDDHLESVKSIQDRVQEHGISLKYFSTLDATRDYLAAEVKANAASVPDVVVTDLRIDDAPDTGGMDLASFADRLYRKQLRVPGRVGVASAFEEEIRHVTSDLLLVFVYATQAILGAEFRCFVNDLRVEAARFRRDRWCWQYDQENPLEFDTRDGALKMSHYFGVISAIESKHVTVNTWRIDSVRSDKTRLFDRRVFDQCGQWDLHQPVRVIEAYDTTNRGCVRPAVYVLPLMGLEDRSYVTLRPNLRFEEARSGL